MAFWKWLFGRDRVADRHAPEEPLPPFNLPRAARLTPQSDPVRHLTVRVDATIGPAPPPKEKITSVRRADGSIYDPKWAKVSLGDIDATMVYCGHSGAHETRHVVLHAARNHSSAVHLHATCKRRNAVAEFRLHRTITLQADGGPPMPARTFLKELFGITTEGEATG